MPYKHDYDKTLTRLNTIISRLNNGESLSVKELAKEFNVSIRTIQRDFNEKLVGLYPIYQDRCKWKMQDGFKIEKSTSVDDTIILDILEKFTDGLGSKFSIKTKSLLSKIKNDTFNPIYAKLNIEDISSHINNITLLEESIKSKRHIKCVYEFQSYEQKLEIKPLKIANFEGFWYLIALDARNDKLKKYHLKSINNIELLDTSFSTKKELTEVLDNAINVWFNIEQDAFEVVLFLDKHASKILKRKAISNSQRVISEYKDGSCDISLSITHEREIISIIQYWIPHIQVVSPKWIEEKVLQNIQNFTITKTQ